MPSTPSAPESATSPSDIPERLVRGLFEDQDNEPAFYEIAAKPGTEYLAELTATYFLRPSFNNGSNAPDKLYPDHPLSEKLASLDLATIEDPDVRQFYGRLQASLNSDHEEPDESSIVNPALQAAALIPGLLRKYSPRTGSVILETLYMGISYKTDLDPSPVYSDVLSAVAECVGAPGERQPADSFYRLEMAIRAAENATALIRRRPEEAVKLEAADAVDQKVSNLVDTADHIMANEFGISPGAIHIINGLMQGYVVAHRSMGEEDDFSHLVERAGALAKAAEGNDRLQRLLKTPSLAQPEFLNVMVGLEKGFDHELLAKGASGIISESYSQASKLTDEFQAEHYLERVKDFVDDLDVICTDPQTASLYKDFLDRTGSMSPKQEARAIRTFFAIKIFGIVEIGEADTLDEIETRVVDNFITALTNREHSLSGEETKRLLKQLDSVAPLLTYTHQHMDKTAHKEAIAGLALSLANGEYEDWRRGDGSEEILRLMKEAGYLPEKLTAQQYKEWITDRTASSFEGLVSSSKDTAEAIKNAVALGSVDIALIAPGYTLNKASLPDVTSARNGLGRLTGMLHKAMAVTPEQALSPDVVEGIATDLGSLGGSQEVRNLLDLLRGGSDPREVVQYIENTRQHLDQLRLLIRIANIDAEEVASGALLSEPDKNGNRKVQHKLYDVLEELKNELPTELEFIPQSVLDLINSHVQENGEPETFTVEDTIDPKVTLEIGETPQRSCQHFQTGANNEGLIGYFGPEVKIAIVRNSKGGIIARTITRLMQNEDGKPVIYTEPVYQSVASPQIYKMLSEHLAGKASAMGVQLKGTLSANSGEAGEPEQLTVRKLKMPAVYSDAGGGVRRESLDITVY